IHSLLFSPYPLLSLCSGAQCEAADPCGGRRPRRGKPQSQSTLRLGWVGAYRGGAASVGARPAAARLAHRPRGCALPRRLRGPLAASRQTQSCRGPAGGGALAAAARHLLGGAPSVGMALLLLPRSASERSLLDLRASGSKRAARQRGVKAAAGGVQGQVQTTPYLGASSGEGGCLADC
ncbi:unnamed protein product, partial [Urochloa humidicola]